MCDLVVDNPQNAQLLTKLGLSTNEEVFELGMYLVEDLVAKIDGLNRIHTYHADRKEIQLPPQLIEVIRRRTQLKNKRQ